MIAYFLGLWRGRQYRIRKAVIENNWFDPEYNPHPEKRGAV